MRDSTFKKAFSATLPVMAGYITLGIAFGILMMDKGYGFIWSVLMALFVFAGSMQFVSIDLLSAGASLISVALMTLMVNARHLFYGVSMLEKYKNTGKIKPYLIFTLTDETYALVCSGNPEGTERRKYYLFVSLLDHAYWIAGCALGSLVGSAITFNTAGIDFAMTALFVVIFTEQCLNTRDHVPAVIGVCSAILCLLIFGADRFLIPTMLLIAASLTLLAMIRQRRAAK